MKKISIFFIILLTSNYVQSLEIIWDLVFDAKYNLAHIPMNIEKIDFKNKRLWVRFYELK